MSGGQAYFPSDVSELTAQYERVTENLRHRYVLSYTSTNSKRDGGWRNVEIRSQHVRHRREQPRRLFRARALTPKTGGTRPGLWGRVKKAKSGRVGGTTDPETLLKLWMAQRKERASRQRRPRGVTVVLVLVAAIALVVMAKYALDVLGILLALIVIGLLLHTLQIKLAESDILSPGWLIIIVLSVAFFAYAFVVPATSVAALGRYVPKWLVTALEWSEERGWGHRALLGPGETGGGPTAVVSTPVSEPSSASPSTAWALSSSPAVALSASSNTSTRGQTVTFMARVSNSTEGRQAVRFYDGPTALGTSDVRQEGPVKIAYLAVRGLAVGQHEIRAEVVDAFGAGTGPSPLLRHTVEDR